MRSRTVPWLRGTARHVACTAVSATGLAALAFAARPKRRSRPKRSLPIEFYDVAVISATDVWGYGQNGLGCTANPADTCLYHWNGKTWTGTPVLANPSSITAAGGHAWFAGLNDVQPVNGNPNVSLTGVPVIYELTGSTVKKVSAPSARVANDVDVAAAPNGRLWLGTRLPTKAAPLTLFHWTGKAWTRIGIPATANGLPLVIEANLAYDNGNGVWWGTYSHWTGSKWVSTFTDAAFDFGLGAVTAIPGAASIWGAGVIPLTPGSQTYDSVIAVYGPLP